ncbi:MAG TPA: XrtB/PEP-CTERM-associated polysaccharide biosynthesis outer membrane protein EpsL [Burkholderiales bacterium]
MRKTRLTGARSAAWTRASLILLGCVLAPAAEAREGNVFTPYANASVTYDDNLFRIPAGLDVSTLSGKSQRGDMITSTQEGLRGDRYLGRQRLTFDASINQARYRTYTYLNADLVNASGTWAWQLGHNLSGEIGSEYLQSLTGFSDVRSVDRNVTSVRNDRATLDYQLHPDWHLLGGLYQTVVENSATSHTGGDFTTQAAEAGGSFTPSSGNHIALRARYTKASYPNQQFIFGVPVSNDFDESTASVDFYWQPHGLSQVSGLLAYARRHYADLAQRDYNGPTGSLNWLLQATGKTQLSLGVKREIGAFFDVTDNYILTDSETLGATYQATPKTQVQARFDHRVRRFLGDPGFFIAGTQRRVDTSNTASLTVNYDVAWPVRISATLARDLRSSTAAGFAYADTSAILSLQFTW